MLATNNLRVNSGIIGSTFGTAEGTLLSIYKVLASKVLSYCPELCI